MGSKMGAEEIRHISSAEELLRFLKDMKFLSEFAVAWDQNIHGDFESAFLVQKFGISNEWFLKESSDSDLKRMTTEELVTDIILRKHDYGSIGLFVDRIVYHLIGSEWDEIISRSVYHEIRLYTEFMNRNSAHMVF